MATTVTNRNHLFETFSASGTVYLTVDNQLAFRHRFEHHIQVNIVYDHTGIPVTAVRNSPSTGLVSDVFTDYSSEACSSFAASAYIPPPMLHDELSKAAASSGCVNNIIQFNFNDRVPSVCAVVEALDCVTGSVSELLQCQDTLLAKAQNNVGVGEQNNDDARAQNNYSVWAQNNDGIQAQNNDGVRAQNNDSVGTHNNDSVRVYNNDSIRAQNNDSIRVQSNDSIRAQNNDGIQAQNNDDVRAQNNESIGAHNNDSVRVYNNDSIRAKNNESIRAQNNDSIRADTGSVVVSGTEVDCQFGCVNSQKPAIDGDDSSVRESQLEDGKLTSKRLPRLSLKISREPANLFQKNFRNKLQELKTKKGKSRVKKGRIKIEHIDQEPAKRSVARSTRTSEKLVKKTEEKISAKHKLKNRDSVNRQRVSKVKKLELEKEVKCEYCLQVFKSQQEYFDHRKGDRKSFECKMCGKAIPFKAHLLVHMKKHDNSLEEAFLPLKELDKAEAQNSELKPPADSGDYKSGKHIKCDMCGLTMSNIPILKTHMMIHTGEFAYKCCVCGERTHSIAKQSSHMATHLKSGKVQCKICNIRFETRSDLSRHQLTHEFKCSLCDKVFPNKTSRVFHYKMDHKEEILRCEVCGKLFSSEEELAPHLKYHRNRAKTQCTVCGLFVTRLDNHILSHNQRPEESKVYICDQCPKQFKQKLTFQRHLRTHSEEKPYVCMECPKRFARSGGLRRHMITHTQEKPFVCSICGKACSQMGNLRIHMQIHKACSPVQCKLCGKNFPYKNDLREHMEATHFEDAEMSSQDPSRNTSNVAQMYYL